MKQYTIEIPDGYKVVETEVDNGFLIHFVKEEKYEPKDGDVVYFSDDIYTWIGIYGKKSNDKANPYALYCSIGRSCESYEWELEYEGNCRKSYDIFRPATPEEQKQLFDALAKAGKMWNGDKKEIVDIPKKEKYEPKDGDICALDFKSSGGVEKLIFCLKSIRGRGNIAINYYFGINGGGAFDTEEYYGYHDGDTIRPATPEEQKQLFDALAKAGKRWDEENNKVVDIPKQLVPDNIHIWRSKEDFGYDQLFIGFNEDKQLLGYNPKFKAWVVYPNHEGYERVRCELVEVKREELKDGDLCFRTDKLNPNVFRNEITNYAIIDGEEDVWIEETPTKGRLSWGYWYKLIQING